MLTDISESVSRCILFSNSHLLFNLSMTCQYVSDDLGDEKPNKNSLNIYLRVSEKKMSKKKIRAHAISDDFNIIFEDIFMIGLFHLGGFCIDYYIVSWNSCYSFSYHLTETLLTKLYGKTSECFIYTMAN